MSQEGWTDEAKNMLPWSRVNDLKIFVNTTNFGKDSYFSP